VSRFEDEWRARFERFARTLSSEASISGWSESGLERRVHLFRSVVPAASPGPAPVALELGCGAGTYVRILAGVGYRAIGLDYSVPSLGRALAADPGRKGHYLAGDAYALPVRSGEVDLVVSIGVLQALSRPEQALVEMARVLRPGGTLLLEALSSRSLAARARRLHARLRRLPPRVLTHDPEAVARWLRAQGLAVQARIPLCLPPRRLPALGRALDSAPIRRAVRSSPMVGSALAHAVWFLCRRVAAGETSA
jgi:SAM-dependent methyltransferase